MPRRLFEGTQRFFNKALTAVITTTNTPQLKSMFIDKFFNINKRFNSWQLTLKKSRSRRTILVVYRCLCSRVPYGKQYKQQVQRGLGLRAILFYQHLAKC